MVKIADVGAASAAMADLKPLQYRSIRTYTSVGGCWATIKVVLLLLLVSLTIQMNLTMSYGCFLGGQVIWLTLVYLYKFGTSDAKKQFQHVTKAGPIASAYVMQDEVTALKAENLRMKQRDEELSAKYEQVQRDNEEMKVSNCNAYETSRVNQIIIQLECIGI